MIKSSKEKINTKNKRKSKPYSVTPLGFLAVLKYLESEEIKLKIDLVYFSKFIPLISKNWEKNRENIFC